MRRIIRGGVMRLRMGLFREMFWRKNVGEINGMRVWGRGDSVGGRGWG